LKKLFLYLFKDVDLFLSFKILNPTGLTISPHLLRQMRYRINDYSGNAFSLYMRQPRQLFNLGSTNKRLYGLSIAMKQQLLKMFFVFGLVFFLSTPVTAVSYSPAAEQEGSTAIHMNDPAFNSWADGYTDYEIGTDVDEVWQTPEYALGMAAGTSYDIVSLGRGGRITMIFDPPVENGEGWDFAVFENSFNDYNLELAYVEVSSNGIDFVRFDNISLIPDPISGYGSLDTTLINGLAGKFRQGYGTPFDLSDLSEQPEVQAGSIDLSRITHIRLVDIVGDGSFFDSEGRVIYDPFPTVNSAGFDLDAIGVSNGAPYPEGSISEGPSPQPPEQSGEAGFGGNSGCFIDTVLYLNFLSCQY